MDTQNPIYGLFQINIDKRGRVLLPATIRAILPESVVMLCEPCVNCLLIYTDSGWLEFNEAMKTTLKTDIKLLKWKRRIVPFVYHCDIGQDGRVLIVPSLRKYPKLERECTLIGMGDHLELWDRAEYERQAESADIKPLLLLRNNKRQNKSKKGVGDN